MQYLSESNLKNKKVIVRCDFNVPTKNGKILDNSKIIKSLKTINYLLSNGNKLILLSHFGRVEKEDDKQTNSLKIVYEELKNYIDLDFCNPYDNGKVNIEKNCVLFENTRFTDIPNKKESINDLELAKYFASYAEVFVMDAFGSSHRVHSSTAGISNYLPTFIGFLIEEEITKLSTLIENIEHPFIVIMGGAKVDDKINLMNSLLTRCDKLVLTGCILNSFLKQKGFNIGKSIVNKDYLVSEKINNIISQTSNKLLFSPFVVTNKNEYKRIELIHDDESILDNIIDEPDIIKNAKTIFLNGTCGLYEDDNYSRGTKELFELLKKSKAKIIIGGGDASCAVAKFGYSDSFFLVSSGGGATLEYLANKNLSAIEYIKNNEFKV